MKPIERVYWLRAILGLVAGVLCIVYGIATGTVTSDPSRISSNTFFNGISLALIVYLASYYALKAKFQNQVAKPQKIFMTGIGIYLMSWLVSWTLLYTLIAGQAPAPL